MIRGLRGSLLSHDALARGIPTPVVHHPGGRDHDEARRRFRAWFLRALAEMGPACGPRAVFDRVAAPLAAALGYDAVLPANARAPADGVLRVSLYGGAAPLAAMLVTAWGVDPSAAWREAVRHGIADGVRWCLCSNGPALRLIDAQRTYSRRYAEIDLATAADDPSTFAVAWDLLSAAAVARGDAAGASTLERAVEWCERFRADVRASLQSGVHDALTHLLEAFVSARGRSRAARAGVQPLVLFDESLVVIYRILFLLFAEARGLVPRWHPVYRDGYTIEALRGPAETHPRPRGLWEALQAIARLAHRGCRAGTLRVPPFNGRLFSPAHAPLSDTLPLDDAAVRNALVALTTRRSKAGVERIAYADLGVEQLGGVYERILDFDPAVTDGGKPRITLVRAARRKATGSFYTPRSLTEYLVRRTLAPLVRDAASRAVLGLRVLDPAMGSGAFLVAACRYLAAAYEAALVREGGVSHGDLGDADRAGFRRTVAQRCLFGVDVNPMAVQLGRLSLWLATLAADRPLTFLDHHLRAGNSLLGAALHDIGRHPFASRRRRAGASLPLFDDRAFSDALRSAVGPRLSIALEPGDTLDQVRAKERLLGQLDRDDGPLARWKQVADLWCARWFPPDDPASAARLRAARCAGVFGALADEALGCGAALPGQVTAPLLSDVRAAAERERFFHWTLEYPEVFYGPDGGPAESGGFDAVLGNPPWEMLRGDRGSGETRRHGADAARRLTEFARGSGVYRLQSSGHANLFQLFLERALSLVRRGGRLGIVLPSGFATDHGCAGLRRHVLDATTVDAFVSIENREGVFPIHRGLRFLLVCATAGGATAALPLHGGITSAEALDRLPEIGLDPGSIVVQRSLVERFTGPQLAIPDLRRAIDVEIVAKVATGAPALGPADGWNLRFGRELNATDDRPHFVGGPRGLPVIEGKHIQPFAVDTAAARLRIPRSIARRLLGADRPFERARLAYRDVAASTNRLTLIAAIVPEGVVTTHTLFCLKDPLDEASQLYLCGVFNSYVANYLVRLRVSTHVTTAIIDRLPVPKPARDSAEFQRIVALASALTRDPTDAPSAAALQATVARLYGLTEAEFRHVLTTFPLIGAGVREEAMQAFGRDA
jgi:N-6 DNA Methylase/Eco57I restriction-modification methylase